MNLHSPSTTLSSIAFSSLPKTRLVNEAPYNSRCLCKRVNWDTPNGSKTEFVAKNSLEPTKRCFLCGRRHFLEAAGMATTWFPILPANAANSDSDYKAMLNKFHPPRADWYEEFFAWVLNSATASYEAEVARYKSQIFGNLREKAQKILEIGIGTGPNLSYYASNSGVQVVGIDPNQKMEKYACSSAESAGLPLSNFEFLQAVGEAIPISDASVDAVIGTLVLCSVKDIDLTLKEVKRVLRPGGLYVFVEHVAAKEGTVLRLVQRVLDPLQRALADGCQLSRETGDIISKAGFSSVDLNMAFVSNAAFINPHIYGVAYK